MFRIAEEIIKRQSKILSNPKLSVLIPINVITNRKKSLVALFFILHIYDQ